MESPYKFNDSAVASGARNLGKQLHKYFKDKEKRPSPDSIQGRANTYLDFAAKNAKFKYSHIIESEKQAKIAGKEADKAKADKIARANATRRETAAHKRKLQQRSELEDLRTQKQVERVKAVAEAKASTQAAPKTVVKKAAAPKPAVKATKAPTPDKEGVLNPVVKKPKRNAKPAAQVNTKAGDAYND